MVRGRKMKNHGPDELLDWNTSFEKSLSKLSENHKINVIGPTELKLWPSLPAAIYAFMVPMEGVAVDEEELVADIQASIRKKIGSFAVPQRYLVSECAMHTMLYYSQTVTLCCCTNDNYSHSVIQTLHPTHTHPPPHTHTHTHTHTPPPHTPTHTPIPTPTHTHPLPLTDCTRAS